MKYDGEDLGDGDVLTLDLGEGYSTVEDALKFEMPYVVRRKVRPYDTATLNYNWQVWETQAFSFYTTSTTTIDRRSLEPEPGGRISCR